MVQQPPRCSAAARRLSWLSNPNLKGARSRRRDNFGGESRSSRSILSPSWCGFSRACVFKRENRSKTMHRWTARLLLLVLLLPLCGPLALARTGQLQAMHCMRKPVQSAQPTMHCHHAMAQTPAQEGSEKSFRSLDCCCGNHDCCRGLKNSEWARPAAKLPSYAGLLIERAAVRQLESRLSAALAGEDSARAPPRS
jgi:hypothetical protein